MRGRQILSLLLVLCLITAIAPVSVKAVTFTNYTQETPNYSVGVASTTELTSRLNALMAKYENTSWTTTGSPCASHGTCYSKYYYGHQCSGFAKYIFNDLFCGGSIGSTADGDYALKSLNNAVLIGQRIGIGAQDGASVKSLLSQAKPGDFIQMHRRNGNPHSMIVVSVSDTGITILDCNSGSSRCTVRVYDQTWDTFASKNDSFSLYRSTKYPEGNSDTSVDVGTNFYAYIINTAHWKLLTNDNNNVSMRSETAAANQVWYFERLSDGSYKILSAYDKNSLDVNNFGTADGTNVQTYPYSGNTAQQWYISGSSGAYVFRAKCADTVLDVANGSSEEGSNIQMWTYNGSAAQLFQIWKLDNYDPAGFISRTPADLGTDFTAPILNMNAWKPIQNCYTEGDKPQVRIADENGYANQLWYFSRQSDGSYMISSCYDGKYLDVREASTALNTVIQTCVNSGSDAQKWFIYEESGGYIIRSKLTYYVLDLKNNDATPGSYLQMHSWNGSSAQIWSIYRGEECVLKGPTLSVDVGNSATSTKFTWNNVYGARDYTLKIWKDEAWVGDTYVYAENASSGYSVVLPAGTYQAYVDSGHEYDYKMSNLLTFTVAEHACTNRTEVTAPTCTEQGYTTYTCSVCGDSYTANYTDALGHSYSYKATTVPTTSTTGELTGTCDRCSGTTAITLPALNMEDYTYSVITEATCTEDGIGHYIWNTTTYGEYSFDTVIEAAGHDYFDFIIRGCTEQGYTSHVCQVCQHSYEDNYTDPIGHDLILMSSTQPTCTEAGSTTYMCRNLCMESFVYEIPPVGHSCLSLVVPPSCVDQGYTAHACMKCDYEYADNYVDALGHSWDEGVVTTEPTTESEGVMTYTCTVCGETRTEAIGKLEHSVTYKSASLSLDGSIGIRYYVELSEDVVNDPEARMEFTIGEEVQVMSLDQAELQNGQYVFTAYVPAKGMADTVTAQMHISAGAVGEAKPYSVKAYCDAAIPTYSQYAAYADLVALMKAMLNYGACSQINFSHNTENLANASLSDADKVLPEVPDLGSYAHFASGSEDGISIYSASLLLESETIIRYYFRLIGSKTIDEYTFIVDGVEVEPVYYANNVYYVEKTNIAAKDLDEPYVAQAGGLSVTFYGLSYVRSTLSAGTSEALLNVVKALYAYNQAANAYFTE